MDLCTPGEILAGTCCKVATGCTGGFGDLLLLSTAALIVSSILLAVIYLWAVMFNSTKINAYVKQELYELVASAIIVIFLLMAIGAMGNLRLNDFVPNDMLPDDSRIGPDTNIYDSAAIYYERVGSDMSGWIEMNYVMNVFVDQVASVTPYARPLGVGLVASPLAGIASPIKSLIYNMSVAVTIAFVINYAQLYVYIFALHGFLKFYIPIGILLRCFTPTRRLGGTIIGVGVVFLFIFPAFANLAFVMFYNAGAGPMLTFSNMIGYYIGGHGNPDNLFQMRFENFFSRNFESSGTGFIGLVTGVFGGIGDMIQNVVGGIFLTLLILPIATVSWAFTLGFIIPAFNTLIMVEAAKILSRSFGEEVDITSLTRLI